VKGKASGVRREKTVKNEKKEANLAFLVEINDALAKADD
jgi:hypothetical protein